MADLFRVSAAQVVKDLGDGPHSAATLLAKYGWTFARADASTCATYVDKEGVVRTAAAGLLRIEYVDLNGDGVRETPTIQLEGSRTNPLLRSEEFDNAAWAKTNITVTPNAVIAPDNTTTGDQIAATASAATQLTQSAVIADTVCTYIMHARKGSGATDANRFGIRNGTTATDLIFGNLNYDTGVWTYTTGSTGVTVAPIGNGFYRITIIATSGITSGNTITAYGAFVGASETAGEYAYLWGGLLGPGIQSSYIKTVASAVTRAADSLTVPFNFGPMDLTVLARVARPVHADATGTLGISPRIYELANPVPFVRAFFNNTARELFSQIDTSGTDASTGAATIPAGAELAYLTQLRNLSTGGQVAHDAGSGLSGFSSAASAFTAWGNQTLNVGRTSGGGGEELYGDLIDLKGRAGLITRAVMLTEPSFAPTNPFEVTDLDLPGPLIAKAQSGRVNTRSTQQIGASWTERYLLQMSQTSHREFLARMKQYWRNGTIFEKGHVDYATMKGVGGGVPLVKGASQTGSTLIVDGCPLNTANWLLAGDIFRVQGLPQVMIVAADVNTEGDGRALIPLVVPIFTGGSPADNATVTITGVMLDVVLLESPDWPETSGTSRDWGQLTLKFSEAL